MRALYTLREGDFWDCAQIAPIGERISKTDNKPTKEITLVLWLFLIYDMMPSLEGGTWTTEWSVNNEAI